MANDGYISTVWNIEQEAFQSDVGVCDGLEFLGVPIRVLLTLVSEIFAEFDVIIKIFEGMLESILEDCGIPIIRPSFIAVDDVYEDLKLWFISVILDNFDDFCFRDVFILYG